MCSPNQNEILNLLFSSGNDEFNWLYNTQTPVETVGGQLRLVPESNTSRFTRSLGTLDPTNNRIRLQVNLDIFRPQLSTHETFCAKFEVFNGSALIDTYNLYIDSIASGEVLEYNFDRIYKFQGLTGAISLKITTTEGYQNEMFLDYIKCWDYNYCDDNVRNYFILENLFEDIVASQSSAIQLLEWKVDGVETLTPEFFSENNAPGGNPLAEWFLADADLDGLNRQAETSSPNTFNPFIAEWGLQFDAGNYYDGKPIGTTSGSDYGSGIMQIGFEKPTILNENLVPQDGAFFIDIDFTKSLKVVFNVLINENNSNVFDSPDIYRKYTIVWDVENCTGLFYYNDVLDSNEYSDQYDNGFLSGITGTESTIEIVQCDESFAYSGNNGVFEFLINFGSDVGQCGISYNAFNQPDKFEIEWNGQVYSSGYVGSNTWDQDLINLGISPTEINTGNPSTGLGNLLFNKDQASPATALVRVTAPLNGTAWNISGVCPDGGVPNQPPLVSISSASQTIQQGVATTFNITASDADGTIESYQILWGDGGSNSGNTAPPATIQHTFNILGTRTIQIQVVDNEGAVTTSTYVVNVIGGSAYQISGLRITRCNTATMNGTLVVTSGQVEVRNEFSILSGTPISATITIDGNNLGAGDSVILGVGSYPFTSTAIDCTNGSGINTMEIDIP